MNSLAYFKYFADDAAGLDAILTDVQYGVLMKKVMRYAETFTKETLPQEYVTMQLLYEFFCEKVNGAKAHYDKKVEQNTKNGGKGGTQKAENARRKKEQQEPALFSLSNAEINDLYNELSEDETIECTKREFTSFLNQLYKNNWYVGNKQMTEPNDIQYVVGKKLGGYTIFSTSQIQWNVFCEYVRMLESYSYGEDDKFFDMTDRYYQEQDHLWAVDGKTYPEKEYKKVLSLLKERLLANLAKT